ncbi:MAG TPA: YbdD/YjiX family protein [Steroidobacteraceae bacterium]|jgi:uncharacterized short protein YbdD (DUF466 family)|nr:YbdD/YjiX family protein [Steroidobacteraceae bacterium]
MTTQVLTQLRRQLASVWAYVRVDAYARYLSHHAAHHPQEVPLSRRDFYLKEQQRKWSGISRCC